MKKKILNPLLSFLLIGAILFMASCNNDDENEEVNYLLGTWSVSTLNPDITINGIAIDAIPPELLGLSESESLFLDLLLSPNSSDLLQGLRVAFKDDLTFTLYSDETEIETGIYDLKNEADLTLIAADTIPEISLTIVNLSANNLDLELREELLIDLNEDGQEEFVNLLIQAILIK